MGRIVKRPVPAPLDLYAEFSGGFFAYDAKDRPFFIGQFPRPDAVNHVSGKPVIVRTLTVFGFGKAVRFKRVLRCAIPYYAMRKHRD